MYTPKGTFNDSMLTSEDKGIIAHWKAEWNRLNDLFQSAITPEDKAYYKEGMETAHDEAERVRSKYGYSGGEDGSEFISVATETVKDILSSASNGVGIVNDEMGLDVSPQENFFGGANSQYDYVSSVGNSLSNSDSFLRYGFMAFMGLLFVSALSLLKGGK